METGLTKKQMAELLKRLEELRTTLTTDLIAEREASEREKISQYSGDVFDRGEESNADSLAEVNTAVLGHHENELQDVKRALSRVEAGTYGLCTDCGDDIAFARLNAYPTASRCHRCQSKAEGQATRS